jgi:hypothetical protein
MGINLTSTSVSRNTMNGCWNLISFFMRRFVSILVATSYQNKLTRFLAKEDCAARSLLKRETQDESGEVDKDSDLDSSDNDNDIEERGKNASTAKSAAANKGISEYAQRREKNIAELKEILEGLKVPKLKRCVITMHPSHMRGNSR